MLESKRTKVENDNKKIMEALAGWTSEFLDLKSTPLSLW
jgi:hypothetical protein